MSVYCKNSWIKTCVHDSHICAKFFLIWANTCKFYYPAQLKVVKPVKLIKGLHFVSSNWGLHLFNYLLFRLLYFCIHKKSIINLSHIVRTLFIRHCSQCMWKWLKMVFTLMNFLHFGLLQLFEQLMGILVMHIFLRSTVESCGSETKTMCWKVLKCSTKISWTAAEPFFSTRI